MSRPTTHIARWISHRLDTAGRPAQPRAARRRLAIQSLEDRTVLSPSTVDYLVTAGPGVPGATVVVIGQSGQSVGVTNDQGISTQSLPQSPFNGVAGVEQWQADVVLPPGYDFYISK